MLWWAGSVLEKPLSVREFLCLDAQMKEKNTLRKKGAARILVWRPWTSGHSEAAGWWAHLLLFGLSSGASGRELLCQCRTWVWSLGPEDSLEEGMANYSSILAWEISWTEEPGRLQFIGSQRVRHDWSDLACTHAHVQVQLFLGTDMTFLEEGEVELRSQGSSFLCSLWTYWIFQESWTTTLVDAREKHPAVSFASVILIFFYF